MGILEELGRIQENSRENLRNMGNSRLDKTYRIKSISRYGKQRQITRHSGMEPCYSVRVHFVSLSLTTFWLANTLARGRL